MQLQLNLEKIKVGDEVVIITPKGKRLQYGGIFTLTTFDEKFQKWRYSRPETLDKDAGWFPPTGFGYYAMHSREVPHFYYSANSKHIEAARKTHKAALIKREKAEIKNKIRFEEFQKKLDDLLAEYGARIEPVQISGDDQGVELEIEISINNFSIQERSFPST